ncbi:hypothetical protein AN958_09735 [Leucoagaricus sp. SymC.cos]|nr:hypothetical protein AN958_09735 [Leucoagaricus sp. SymC.cos]
MASSSTTSVATIRPENGIPPPPSPTSTARATNGHSNYWASAVSLAHATIGDGSDSRRVSMIEEASSMGSIVDESPPDYVEALVPTYQMDYTFSPVDGDYESMQVIPPPDAMDTRPLYHIRVTHDLFDPSFFVTSIRRGGGDGHLVGDFTTKADCSALEETIYFKKSEDHIFKKLVAGNKKDEARIHSLRRLTCSGLTDCEQFQWKLQHASGGLLVWRWETFWTCRYCPEQTTSKNKNYDIVAQFSPPMMRTPSSSRKAARMTMEPAGQKFFDEILLSILILERKRRKVARRRK